VGAAIIKARGASSAASAANAGIDTVWSLAHPTPASDWHSVAICSDGSYGVEKGLISSFPIRTVGDAWEIVQNMSLNDFSRSKIDASVKELKEEKGLDAASSEFYDAESNAYVFKKSDGSMKSADELVALYQDFVPNTQSSRSRTAVRKTTGRDGKN
jgi:enolase